MSSPTETDPAETPAPEPAGHTPVLPEGYPTWARELAELYLSGTTCLFVLHGNVHDLIRSPTGAADAYCSLPEFLATQVFGSWDVVLQYDLARGLRPVAGGDAKRLQGMVQATATRLGDPAAWPRDPENVLLSLDRLVERTLLEEPFPRKGPDKTGSGRHYSKVPDPVSTGLRKSLALVFDSAQYLVPAGDLGALSRGQGTNLVRFLNWAQNPYIKRVNIAFCLIADKLTEVNDRLVQCPHVAAVEVPLPDRDERGRFCRSMAPATDGAAPTEFTTAGLAELSNGLSLVSLQVLLSQGKRTGRAVNAARFRQLKKTMIERQCQGLLEFLEPEHTLDLVVGLQAAKDRLRGDAELLSRGRKDAAPMGYLLCGPVGTGKSFLAECYAGSIGIPCVTLRNFRSKFVGETEGNLEQVLTVLRGLGPVVVVIDEADAALGSRQAEGDSGTSSRVFAMIARQMGDTRYRGQIVWMLLTSRPDLLPIDLKRQGRAEVHIPLFYPQGEAEVRPMLLAMGRKNRVPLAEDELPAVRADRHLSGSDLESLVLSAHRRALADGRDAPRKADLEAVWEDFIPSAQGLEKELQELAAVLECTQLSFLPLTGVPASPSPMAAPSSRSGSPPSGNSWKADADP